MDDLRTKRVYDPDRHVYGVRSWWTTPGGWHFELKVWPHWSLEIAKYRCWPVPFRSQTLCYEPRCSTSNIFVYAYGNSLAQLFCLTTCPDWRLFFGMLPHCRQHRNAGPMVDWLMAEAPDPIQRFITEECLL